MRMDLLQDSVGTRCMILSKDNELLFFGEIAYCDVVNKTIRINGDSASARQFVKPDDWVKLNLKQGDRNPHFLLVEGEVAQVINNYFVLEVKLIIEKSEEREYFRQSVLVKSVISVVNGKYAGHPCVLVDVSATGIAFQSNETYQIGDRLWIKNQKIRDGGANHNLEFLVVRQQDLKTGPYRHFYGCKFENLSTDAQDRLCCDIFALQAAQLRSARKN